MRCIVLLLGGWLWGVSAFGATAASYFDLDLRENRYLGVTQSSTQSSNYTFISGDMNLETETRHFSYKLNPVAEGAIEVQNEFYLGVPEAYVQPRGIANGFNFTIGRQRRTWSRLDEEFNLGVWQPQLRWDYLAPRQQGLIGVFFDLQFSENLQVLFFTSPLFIPDQGPSFQIKNGQFTSGNRWFMAPQSRLALFSGTQYNHDAPLYFDLDRPSEEEVVLHSSFGFGFRFQTNSPFWIQTNYAYKPQNQIHLGIECKNCAQIGNGITPVEVTAVVHPVVVNHHVLTIETGFDRVDDRGYLSVTGDFPNASGLPANYEESPLSSMVIAGGAYQHYLYPLIKIPSWLKYSYMKVFDIHTKDKNGLVDADQVQSSLDRYPYREVAAVEWKVLMRQKRMDRLEVKTRYSYSVPEKGGWLSAGVDWSQGPLTWSVGLDFLGSDTDPDSPNAGLYTRYRENDRVFGGVNYVF